MEYLSAGRSMLGHFARPDGDGPFPAVLIAHGANGLDEYQRHRPELVAAEGYAAFAMDYHGAGRVYEDRSELQVRMQEFAGTPGLIARTAADALAVMLDLEGVDQTRVAAIGFCFGAVVAMELAWTGADLTAVVGFHPGFSPPADRPNARFRAKVLMCVGADDPLVPPGTIEGFGQEMSTAGVDWQVHLYSGVQHNFTHPGADQMGVPGLAYDPTAARRSWRSMLDLFSEVM